MPVPDFQSFFKPLLDFAADGEEHSISDARQEIARTMNITAEDRAERLPSGTQTKFDNRIAWAKSFFIQAGILEATRRAHFRITDRGRELHREGLERIDVRILDRYPEFVEFHTAETETPQTKSSELIRTSSSKIEHDFTHKIMISEHKELRAFAQGWPDTQEHPARQCYFRKAAFLQYPRFYQRIELGKRFRSDP